MSKQLRLQAAYLREENRKHSDGLMPLELPTWRAGDPVAAWRSNRFLVQLFAEANGAQRITINRTMIDDVKGGWLQGITWDEIQQIKRQIGFGDRYAVEVYPADADVVNVANMRHIWLTDPPAFAWRKDAHEAAKPAAE